MGVTSSSVCITHAGLNTAAKQKSTLERVAIQRICATIQEQLNQFVEQDLSQIVTRRHSAQVNTHFAERQVGRFPR
jgi:hypothetical protein